MRTSPESRYRTALSTHLHSRKVHAQDQCSRIRRLQLKVVCLKNQLLPAVLRSVHLSDLSLQTDQPVYSLLFQFRIHFRFQSQLQSRFRPPTSALVFSSAACVVVSIVSSGPRVSFASDSSVFSPDGSTSAERVIFSSSS